MGFKDRYTYKNDEPEKIKVTADSFLQAEMIEELINKIEHTRISLL